MYKLLFKVNLKTKQTINSKSIAIINDLSLFLTITLAGKCTIDFTRCSQYNIFQLNLKHVWL